MIFSHGLTGRRAVSGFSLLEVLVSFIVIIIGVLALVQMQVYLDKRTENARMGIVALNIAEDKLEDLLALNYILIGSDAGSVSAGTSLYHWVVTSTPAMSGNAKKMKVSVTWSDRWGQSQGLSLSTLRSKFN